MKKRKKSKKNNKIKDRLLIFIMFFLLALSYFELNSDIRLGNIIKDLIFYPSSNVKTQAFIKTYETELIEENKELKKIMNIKLSLTDFDIEYGTVIERNNSYWLEELTINKGLLNGIKKDSPVITEGGLIGKISSVSLSNSTIKLITNEESSIPITINKKNKLLTTKNNKVIIRGINAKDKIKVGDSVTTSGLSSSFPKGILIGTVSSITKEKDKVGYIAEVKLSSNIDNLRFVAVLKRKISW